jgi:hypothetical protein
LEGLEKADSATLPQATGIDLNGISFHVQGFNPQSLQRKQASSSNADAIGFSLDQLITGGIVNADLEMLNRRQLFANSVCGKAIADHAHWGNQGDQAGEKNNQNFHREH